MALPSVKSFINAVFFGLSLRLWEHLNLKPFEAGFLQLWHVVFHLRLKF